MRMAGAEASKKTAQRGVANRREGPSGGQARKGKVPKHKSEQDTELIIILEHLVEECRFFIKFFD